MQTPSITVLMAVYNGASWLDESIPSVLKQTYGNFEFIIVNDGSTDQSLEIIRHFAATDSRVVIIDKNNTGLADSLNCGIRVAKGHWIARLDADDLCMPDRLKVFYNRLKSNHSVVLAGSDFVEIDDAGKFLNLQHYPTSHSKLVRNLERYQRFFPHSSAFIRADVARQIGGYNERIVRSQDHDFWFRLSEKGNITCINQPLVKIRRHARQISHEESGMRSIYYDFASTICHYLRKNGQRDPSVEMNVNEWVGFVDWVRHEIEEEVNFVYSRKVWANARDVLHKEEKNLITYIYILRELLLSGCLYELLKERYFGTLLPKRLADKWAETTMNTISND